MISLLTGAGGVLAETVWESGGTYYWDSGSSPDLATAIMEAVGDGGVTVDIRCGGTLTQRVDLKVGTTLKGNNNTFNVSHDGTAFYLSKNQGSGLNIYDMTLNCSGGCGFVIHEVSDIVLQNIAINGADIGMRIDSHGSRAYNYWVYNVSVLYCTFEDCASHGLETYSIDGFSADGLVAKNCGGCGVCLNRTTNGAIGTVDSYRSPASGGYAGFRCCNDCDNLTVDYVKSIECGRGIFILTGSDNITIDGCLVMDSADIGIWIEQCDNVNISGYCSSAYAVSGTGSSIDVTIPNGTYRLISRKSGKVMDAAYGLNSNGTAIVQWPYKGASNQQWNLTHLGGGKYSIIGVKSGKAIDISGASTANGAAAQLYTYWAGGSNQKFIFTSLSDSHYYRITPSHATDKCLDVKGASTADGAKIIQWSYSGSPNQQWELRSP